MRIMKKVFCVKECLLLARQVYLFVHIVCVVAEAGTYLADGWFGSVWSLLGDHDYKRDCLNLPNINSATCCGLCPADSSSSGVPWFDFRPNAQWVRQTYKRGGFDVSKCILFLIAGVSNLTNCPDWMHDKPLGTDKVYYVGGVLC